MSDALHELRTPTAGPSREDIEAKIAQVQASLAVAQQRRSQHLTEADRLRSQIDAHMGALQVLKDLMPQMELVQVPDADAGTEE